MDKYEYKLRTEQMLKLMDEGSFSRAADVADSIDWNRVRNATMLTNVSDIYEKNNELQKSYNVLNIAYQRASGSRKVIYRLCTLALKTGNLDEALDFYDDFVEIAPKDPNQYILRYEILRAKNAPIEQQIEALEKYKQEDYVEKWAYELARLYQMAGMTNECLEECDDIILWFSEGSYVYQAMELKMKHKPLTPTQQEKYDRRFEQISLDTAPINELTKEAVDAARSKRNRPEFDSSILEPSQELPSLQTILINSSVERRLSDEVRQRIENIVASSPGAMRKERSEFAGMEEELAAVENLTDLQLAKEIVAGRKERTCKSTPTVDRTSLPPDIQQMLEEIESKATAKLMTEEPTQEESMLEYSTGGILTSEDSIPEESMLGKSILEESILEESISEEVIPEYVIPEYVISEEVDTEESIPEEVVSGVPIIEDYIMSEPTEEVLFEESPMTEQEIIQEQKFEEFDVDEFLAVEQIENEDWSILGEEDEDISLKDYVEEAYEETAAEISKHIEQEFQPIAAEENVLDDRFVVNEVNQEGEVEEEVDIMSITTPLSRKETAKMYATGKTAPLPIDAIENAMSMRETGFVVKGRYDLESQGSIGTRAGLTEEQKNLFSYFVPVRGMSEQLVEVLEQDRKCTNREGTSRTGNLLVIGNKGSGKTVLAVDIVKAIHKQRNVRQGKVAIVTGDALNKKKVSEIVAKLRGGALIIEKAGRLNEKTITRLNKAMERDTAELLVVLEEQRKPLDRVLSTNPEFRKKFTSRVEIPVFINDELVTFGQTYAQENGYRMDEMGILALYSRIDGMQREDHAVSVEEVKEIMDLAMDHAGRASAKKLVRRVLGKNTDDADRIILSEKDFQE